MKKLVLRLSVLGALIAIGIACGKSENNNVQPNPYYGYPPTSCVGSGCPGTFGSPAPGVSPTPISGGFTSGDTEPMNVVSNSVLAQYVGSPLNNPGPVSVNIALNPAGGSPTVYLGTMSIQFQDGYILHRGTFSNGQSLSSYNKIPNTVHILTTDSGGAPTYRIFFEDPAGAIVLTMRKQAGSDTNTPLIGQVWFHNFNSSAPNPLYQGAYDMYGTYYPPGIAFCWQITLGPYDCRNFNVPPSNNWNDNGTNVPAFILLGNIPSIDPHKALGI